MNDDDEISVPRDLSVVAVGRGRHAGRQLQLTADQHSVSTTKFSL
jgi:hypothetical protein